MDTVTQVTHQSYGRRLGSSFGGMLLGPVFFIGAIALLVWNEGNAVSTHRSLNEGAKATVEVVDPSTIDPANEGKLVHVVGGAETSVSVVDSTFGVAPTSKVLKLKRDVEMYQWVEKSSSETKKNTGGSTDTTTTYSYTKEWSPTLIHSSSFKKPENHQNPTFFPYEPTVFKADPITLGAFTLSSDVVMKMDWYTAYPETVSLQNIPDETLRGKAHVIDRGFFVGSDPKAPSIGDSRVTYQVLTPQVVSILAQQVGNSFSAYPTRAGKSILIVENGPHTAKEMFQHAQNEATALAWFLRFVGFLFMYFGLVLLIRPLTVLFDVLPFLGNLVEGVTCCIMLPVALVLSMTIIAFSWLAYRPLLAVPFLLLVGGCVYYLVRKRLQSAPTRIPHAYAVSVVDDENDLELQAQYK